MGRYLQGRRAPNHPDGPSGCLPFLVTKKKSRRAPPRLSIVTANVSSWQTARKYISDAEEDILMLQETKASDAQVDSFRNAARKKGYILRSPQLL